MGKSIFEAMPMISKNHICVSYDFLHVKKYKLEYKCIENMKSQPKFHLW